MALFLTNMLKPKLVFDSLFSRGLHSLVRDHVPKLGGGNIVAQTTSAPDLLVKVFNVFGITSVRNNVRNHFPKPDERKRVLRHGWRKRMSTLAGRKIIMRRILKGRHVLSH